ncbi:hypothetical protein [Pseudoduganella violaceinigra]|uniref:hypothetical protein n=1 Tax=Pseudoduganella violaceinigra TaxID=246602 RepID=UPI0004057E75|nr:hypothetical protein [Pseudoduganella violaceinigra]
MAVSKSRLDASRFFLRLAIGGMAILMGFEAIRHSAFPSTLSGAGHWGLHLAEMLCGVLIMIGLLMPIASLVLTLVVGIPIVLGWMHGAPILGNLHSLFLLLVVVATALGGAGQWALGRD